MEELLSQQIALLLASTAQRDRSRIDDHNHTHDQLLTLDYL